MTLNAKYRKKSTAGVKLLKIDGVSARATKSYGVKEHHCITASKRIDGERSKESELKVRSPSRFGAYLSFVCDSHERLQKMSQNEV